MDGNTALAMAQGLGGLLSGFMQGKISKLQMERERKRLMDEQNSKAKIEQIKLGGKLLENENPNVRGRGFEILKSSGIDVGDTGQFVKDTNEYEYNKAMAGVQQQEPSEPLYDFPTEWTNYFPPTFHNQKYSRKELLSMQKEVNDVNKDRQTKKTPPKKYKVNGVDYNVPDITSNVDKTITKIQNVDFDDYPESLKKALKNIGGYKEVPWGKDISEPASLSVVLTKIKAKAQTGQPLTPDEIIVGNETGILTGNYSKPEVKP